MLLNLGIHTIQKFACKELGYRLSEYVALFNLVPLSVRRSYLYIDLAHEQIISYVPGVITTWNNLPIENKSVSAFKDQLLHHGL